MSKSSQTQGGEQPGGEKHIKHPLRIVLGALATVLTGLATIFHAPILTKLDIDLCAPLVAQARANGGTTSMARVCSILTNEESIEKAAARLKKAAAPATSPAAAPVASAPSSPLQAPLQAPAVAAAPPVGSSPPGAAAPPATKQIAAVTALAPPSVIEIAPLDRACPRRSIPRDASTLADIDDTLCALAACMGDAAAADPNIAMLMEWRSAARKLERTPCRFADRKALTADGAYKVLLAGINEMLDPSLLPKDVVSSNTCRSVQDKMASAVLASRSRLLPPERAEVSCPSSGASLSQEVATFTAKYSLATE